MKFLVYLFWKILLEFINKNSLIKKNAEDEMHNYQLFVSSISHDLKNPLNAILGCIDELGGFATSEEEKDLVSIAATSGQMMMFLIADIQDVGKINAGKFEINRVNMKLKQEIQKIYKIEREVARHKGLPLYLRFLSRIPSLVHGDTTRFTQILVNLIGNAVKFTSKGYVAITLCWVRTKQEINNGKIEDLLGIEGDNPIVPESFFLISNDEAHKKSSSKMNSWSADDTQQELVDDTRQEELEEGLTGSLKEKLDKYNNPKLFFLPDTSKDLRVFNTGKQHSLCLSDKEESIPKKVPIFSQFHAIRQNIKPSVRTDGCKNKFSSLLKNKTPNLSRKKITRTSFTPFQIDFGSEGFLVVNILDTGVGMKEEEVKRLFKPYSQANSKVIKCFGGTGLGLYITKEITELMSGKITVRSQYGVGSNFRVVLPFKVIYREEKKQNSLASSAATLMNAEFLESKEKCRRLRLKKVINFIQEGTLLKLLLVEPENSSLSKIDQVISQLGKINIKIFHSFYSETKETIEGLIEEVNAVVVIAGIPTDSAKAQLKICSTLFKQKFQKTIPEILLTDIGMMNDFKEYDPEMQIPFPLSRDSLLNVLSKQIHKQKNFKRTGSALRADSGLQTEKQIRVLLADDDISCNFTLRRMIEKNPKYQVTHFFDGMEPCQYYEERTSEISIIILDIEMPKLNGIEAAKRIRNIETQRGQTTSVPIIGLSGHDSSEIQEKCMRAGMDIILSKPVHYKSLMYILSTYTS